MEERLSLFQPHKLNAGSLRQSWDGKEGATRQSEAGSPFRLIDRCSTQRYASGPSRTCIENNKAEYYKGKKKKKGA
jgi:hypothetical protein